MKNSFLFVVYYGMVCVGEEFGETGGKVIYELVGYCF